MYGISRSGKGLLQTSEVIKVVEISAFLFTLVIQGQMRMHFSAHKIQQLKK
jgi:hypothetical protein